MSLLLVLLAALCGGVAGGYIAVRRFLAQPEGADEFDAHLEAAQDWLDTRKEAEEDGEGWKARHIEDEPLCDDCLMAVLTLRTERGGAECEACGASIQSPGERVP